MPDRDPDRDDEKPAQLRPLHGGRHNLPPDIVAFNQRERLLAALAATVAEHGYNKATIAQITDAAQVSRRTFYENFSGKEDCFLAAFDAIDSYLDGLIAAAIDAEAEWPDQVATALTAFLRFFASRPQLARLYLVESAAAGESMASRREQRIDRFIALLELGRRAAGRELAEGIEEALVGGVITLLIRRILAGQAAQLERFAPAAIELVLSPYLGVDEARSLAARHAPPSAS